MNGILRFRQIDVFADQALAGNPAAVVLDGDGLPDELMQAIAREMNLSETVFLVSPSGTAADYKARFFTTRREIAFAGHATLAAAYVIVTDLLLERPVQGALVQQCAGGQIIIETGHGEAEDILLYQAPPQSIQDVSLALGELATALGLPKAAAVLGVHRAVPEIGASWLLVEIQAPADLRACQPNTEAVIAHSRSTRTAGFSVFTRFPEPDVAAAVRTFAPLEGIVEDPVSGSCHSAIAALMLQDGAIGVLRPGQTLTLRMRQGSEIFRPGVSLVRLANNFGSSEIAVGGRCIKSIEGTIRVGSVPAGLIAANGDFVS